MKNMKTYEKYENYLHAKEKNVVIVERRIFIEKIVVLKTLQFSSFYAIIFRQLESSDTVLSLSISIWWYIIKIKKKIEKIKKILLLFYSRTLYQFR